MATETASTRRRPGFLARLGPALTTLLVIDVVLVTVFAVLLATTLADGADPADREPTPTAEEPEPEESPEETPDDATEEVGAIRTFVLPQQNIHCELSEDAATCTILAFSFEAPPAPEGCEGTVGNVLTVRAGQPAEFACVEGDPPGVPEDATVLEYGEQSTVGEMTCASSTNGVLCRHNPSGEGFSVARAGYIFF